MAMEIFRLIGSVFVDTDEAEKSINKTDEKANNFGKTLLDGVTTVAKWGAAVAAGAAAAGTAMLAVATNAASAMDAIDKGSAKIGISKTAYQEWSYVLGQNGMDIDKLEVGMKTLVSAMDGAAAGTESAVEKFDALGLSIYDSSGKLKDQEAMLNEALFALADMENGTEKARLATELFGKAGVEMMPMLNGGSEGMADLTQRAHELGLVMSDEAVTAGVVLGDTIDDVKQSFGAFATKLGVTLMPTIQKILDVILENLPVVQEMFEKTGQIAVEAYTFLKEQIDAVAQSFRDAGVWISEHETLVKLVTIAIGALTAAIIAYNTAQAIKKAGGIVEIAQLAAIQVGLWGLTAAETAHTAAATIGTAVTTAFGAAVNFLTSPITLVVLAIGALIAIIYLLVENWDTVKAAAISCWDWISGVWNSVADWFNTNVIQPVANFFVGLWDSIVNIFQSVIDWVKNNFESIILFITNPFAGVFSYLYENFEGFRNFVDNIVAAVKDFFVNLWNDIVNAFHTVIDPWIEIIRRAIPLIHETVIQPIIDFFRNLWVTVSSFFVNLWNDVTVIFSTVADWFNTNIIRPITDAFNTVVGVIKDAFSKAWEGVKSIWSGVSKFFSDIWNGIKNAFGSVGSWFKDIFSKAWSGIKSAWSSVSNFFSDIWNGIKNAFGSVGSWFKDVFSKAWEAVKNVFSAGGKIFDGIKDGIANVFKTVVNGIIRGINKVIAVPFNAINKMLSKIRDISILGVSPFSWISTFSVPEIPELEAGGVLERGQIGLLEGNGAEAVVPLHNNKKWISAVASDMESAGIGSEHDTLQQLLEAFSMFVAALPDVLSDALDDTKFTVNKREFARLVKAVE